ncbi:MAG TPA: tetratricopeptide repeat protein [Chthoniobacterales bacterium]|jgi:TolB-like protein/Flp pilus assembly protein TadD
MDGTVKAPGELAIGHVLFIDIVGYSKLLTSEQRERQQELNRTVRETEQFRAAEAAGKLVRVPTGDGMVLAFFTSPDAPLRCAVAISRAVQGTKQLPLRMGIHSGPVDPVEDVNDKPNLAGAGVNIAQRVMNCGDAGHILLSARAADDLAQHAEWKAQLHEIGEAEVKHGVKIGVVNFFDDNVGNSTLPEKLQRLRQLQAAALRRRTIAWSLGIIALLAVAGAAFWMQSRRAGLATASGGELQKSIAVLPLENLSEDKADAFFADGIQDDVLTSLSKISDLKVISRTSVMQYRSAKRNLRDIGHALGAGNILEGSVRRVGNRVLVNVQLIDAIHDRHLWSERYDRTLTDSIGLQGELATQIAHALRATLEPGEKALLATKPTNSPEAYVLYLKAREKERTAGSKEDAFAIDGIYDQAVALDPKFAVAMARQSMWNSVMYRVGRRQAQKIKAQALATEALRLAPDSPEPHMALGFWFRMTDNNFDAALKEFLIAAQTIPNDPEILGEIATIYRRQSRWREALINFRRAQELDPAVPHEGEAQTALMLRDWPAATADYRHLLEIDRDNAEVKSGLAEVLMVGEGDFATAKAILDQVPYPVFDNGGRRTVKGLEIRWQLFMLQRDFNGAEKVLLDFPGEDSPQPFVGAKSFFLGCTAFARGDPAKARVFFEKARPAYETLVHDHPDEPPFLAPLGLLYAYLGRKEDALRASRRAIDLLPEKDPIERPGYLGNLALVYALTGESEKAITLVEQLLTTPATDEITLTQLRSWRWDPLRTNPRFLEILAGPEPKTVY